MLEVLRELVISTAEPLENGLPLSVIAVRHSFTHSFIHSLIDTPKCPAETISGISYPQTDAGSSATVPCGQGFSGSYTRACSATGVWQSPTNDCGKKVL